MRNEQCGRVFTNKMSGKRFDRPEFLKMLDMARPGDVIVVWRLDRLGRSLKQLIETVTMLGEKGIELRSLKENIDTTTPTGKLMFHIIGAMAEFERDVIRERTQAGLEAAVRRVSLTSARAPHAGGVPAIGLSSTRSWIAPRYWVALTGTPAAISLWA